MKSIYAVVITIILIGAAFGIGYETGNMHAPSKAVTKYVTVIDDYNTVVKIPQPVSRIVSLAPSDTEILYSLGIGNKIVGDTIYATFPPAAKNITHVGGVTNASVEKIVALRPDLVLAFSNFEPNVINKLRTLHIPVIVLDPVSLKAVLHDISIVGYATNTTARGKVLVNMLQNIMNHIYNKTISLNPNQRVRVLYMTWYKPIWTAGADSFINSMIITAGGINVAATVNMQFYQMSESSAIAANPSVILVSSSTKYIINEIENSTVWSNVTAIKTHHFVVLSDMYLQQPGPQIFIGVEKMAKAFYPTMFSKLSVISLAQIFPNYAS